MESMSRCLNLLPPIQRRQLLEGNWDVAEGAAFVEFDPLTHVITPFELPLHWERVKAVDYGYAAEVLLFMGNYGPKRWNFNNI